MVLTALPGASQQAAPAAQAVSQTAFQTDRWQSLSPRAWADVVVGNQEQIIRSGDDVPLRYLLRKVDAKGDMTRQVIESRDGSVARLVQRNGAPITAEEDAAERQRLQDVLNSPEAFFRHHRHDKTERDYALELVHALPGAMQWSYAPGQPQEPAGTNPQIVLDFTPDPRFKPPTLITEGLTGVAGRLWIDAQTHCVARLEIRILHPVNFGWGGMLARIGAGGTVEMEQALVGDHRWIYSHLSEHLSIREVMIHTVQENTEIHAWDAHVLPRQISYQDAVHELLAMPVQTR